MKINGNHVAIAAIILFTAYALIGATIVHAFHPSSTPVTALLEDGQYTAYNIQPMYDGKDGTPIFYVTGGKGHMSKLYGSDVYIEPNDISLFFVPRTQIQNGEKATLGTTYKVVIENGIGRLE